MSNSMRIKSKTTMDRMNAEKADGVLDELESKYKSGAVKGLTYISNSPPMEHGGFHPTTVQIAKDALKEIGELREALLLYHEAWNGCEGNWHKAMKSASQNAEKVLWPKG